MENVVADPIFPAIFALRRDEDTFGIHIAEEKSAKDVNANVLLGNVIVVYILHVEVTSSK